jgi:phosphoribosylformylglycinamidine cyclo-ligase
LTAPDGIGTKTIILSAADLTGDSASNLLGMTAGDVTRWGGLPLVFVNILEAKTLGKPDDGIFESFRKMMMALGMMAAEQGYVLINGETAQMGDCVSSEFAGDKAMADRPIFNWSGTMIGVIHKDKLIDGSTLKQGQRIIALRDNLRSNGASLCRRYLREAFGKRWWLNPEARKVMEAMSVPSMLYDRFLATMNGWYNKSFKTEVKVHAIAHLSGGGIESKFGEGIVFPHGLSAVLDDLWEPPQFMKDCVKHMAMSDEEAYTVFNGGQGALAVVDDRNSELFCRHAKAYGIEAKPAGFIGHAHKGEGEIIVRSMFSGKEFPIFAKK